MTCELKALAEGAACESCKAGNWNNCTAPAVAALAEVLKQMYPEDLMRRAFGLGFSPFIAKK